MTTADVRLELRQPLWARAWFVVLPIVAWTVLLSGVVPLRGDPGWATRIFMCVLVAALFWRLFRLAAIGTSDGRLVVRNHWRDRTLHRDDVAEISVADMHRSSFRKSVQLTLLDGSTLRLDVSEVPFGTRRLERQAAAVREWVSGRQQPFR